MKTTNPIKGGLAAALTAVSVTSAEAQIYDDRTESFRQCAIDAMEQVAAQDMDDDSFTVKVDSNAVTVDIDFTSPELGETRMAAAWEWYPDRSPTTFGREGSLTTFFQVSQMEQAENGAMKKTTEGSFTLAVNGVIQGTKDYSFNTDSFEKSALTQENAQALNFAIMNCPKNRI